MSMTVHRIQNSHI